MLNIITVEQFATNLGLDFLVSFASVATGGGVFFFLFVFVSLGNFKCLKAAKTCYLPLSA